MNDDKSDRWGGGPWGGWPGAGWSGPGWGARSGWPGHGPGGHAGFGSHGHRPGPPPWVRDLMRQFGGPHQPPPRGPRARRGDVRAAILDVLAGDEMNGYQVIQQISERTGGAWKPSPGSIYPTIQQLEDEGLVEGRDVGGRRLLRLTDEGRAYVEEHAAEMGATWAPFQPPAADGDLADDGPELLPVMSQVAGALWQVMTTGTAAQRGAATEVMRDTRRRLYGLLAEGGETPPPPPD